MMGKKKILLYKWKVFNQEDIKNAFEKLNHDVTIYEGRVKDGGFDGDTKIDCEKELLDAIKEHDYVFSVNYFPHLSFACEQVGRKYVCWTVDSPMLSMYHISVFNECNYIFIFDMFSYMQIKRLGVKKVWYLPLAADTERLEKYVSEENSWDDISFVGGLYYKNSYDEIYEYLTDELREYFDNALSEMIGNYSYDDYDNILNVDILSKLMERVHFKKDENALTDISMIFQSTFLGYKLAQLERIEALNRLANVGKVSLYSDRFSEKLVNVEYRGTVNYMEQMPVVFNNSAINMNFTIRNIRTGLSLRVWDILGAGGFLLTNNQTEIGMYFEDGKELAVFNDFDEMQKKAEYYIKNADERRNIANEGRKKIEMYHTYVHRIEYILDKLL